MTSPHDALFRFVFGDCEHAAGLLRSALPADVAAAIDWTTLERLAEPHPDGRGGERVCDLLFSCRLRSGPRLLLYVVLEHKSRGRRFDVLQVFAQVTAVLERYRREHPGERFLPAVLPVVLHVGRRPWAAPVSLRELFDVDALPAGVVQHLPDLTVRLDDVNRDDERALRDRALSLTGLWSLASLRYLPALSDDPKGLARWLETWADVIEEVVCAPTGQEAVRAISSYLLQTSRLPRLRVEVVMQRILNERAMTRRKSTYDQIVEEERAHGSASVVLRQLTRRFGPLPDGVEQRVRTAGSEDLDRWADRLLDAATLDEVFEGA
ncbi:MAG: Rpn family recombination-promoting nuclease/putative transposase [Planctomycetes bacterium]|nr:Rpn family recombination-promoting nuclease/putative transposase [Planctomycetota bacterium]